MTDQAKLASLHRVAETWLKRPLTPEEVRQLETFFYESGALDLGKIYQSMAHATGILYENAVAAQQQQNTLSQAAANEGVMQIYSVDTTAAAGNLTSLLAVLKVFG